MNNNDKKRTPKLKSVNSKKPARVGEREQKILIDLLPHRYRILTADQIFFLHFQKGSKSYCNERLRVLFHKPYQYVNRMTLPIEYGKGSPKLAYSITKRGSDYLQSMGLYASVSPNKAYKIKNSTLLYRKHEIAINDVRIAVEMGVKNEGWELVEWISDVDFKNPDLIKLLKVYDSESGSNIPVAPDGFFAIRIPSLGREVLFFLELVV